MHFARGSLQEEKRQDTIEADASLVCAKDGKGMAVVERRREEDRRMGPRKFARGLFFGRLLLSSLPSSPRAVKTVSSVGIAEEEKRVGVGATTKAVAGVKRRRRVTTVLVAFGVMVCYVQFRGSSSPILYKMKQNVG